MAVVQLSRCRVVPWILLAVLPAALVSTLLGGIFRCTLADYTPYYSDELAYWHETLTFTRVGFAGGCYTIEERTPIAGGIRFGPHGPMFAVLFGTLGRVFGWHVNSAPIFSLLLVGVAMGVFAFSVRLSAIQSALVGAVMMTCWAMLLLLPTNMQEGVHFAIAIALAGSFLAVLAEGASMPSIRKLSVLTLLLFASLLRPTWCLLLLPFFLLTRKGTGERHPQRSATGLYC